MQSTSDEIKKVIDGDEPYAHVSMEKRNPPYGYIILRITMPRVSWSIPRVVIELSAQVGGDENISDIFMRPYAIRAGIGCTSGSTVDLASAEAGIKHLRKFNRLRQKYEDGTQSDASFPVQAQMLLVACGCNHLIHEPDIGWDKWPDIGWDKWPYDLTAKAMSHRGRSSMLVFEKMVGILEDFARTC